MKKAVVLSVRGRQKYENQEPETIELVTEGTMTASPEGWDISYQETELTGMEGVTTTFHVEPGKVILTRTGALNSRMVFQEGVSDESLYQMPFGTLMLSVTATQVFFDLTAEGGRVDLSYDIAIENSDAGVIDYHLDIRAK